MTLRASPAPTSPVPPAVPLGGPPSGGRRRRRRGKRRGRSAEQPAHPEESDKANMEIDSVSCCESASVSAAGVSTSVAPKSSEAQGDVPQRIEPEVTDKAALLSAAVDKPSLGHGSKHWQKERSREREANIEAALSRSREEVRVAMEATARANARHQARVPRSS